MKREKRTPNTVKINIEKPEDIYELQEALIKKGDDRAVRTASEELASNMIEFNEKGYIVANCVRVDCFIKKDTVNKQAEMYLRLGMFMEKEFNKLGYSSPIKVNKDSETLGGFGLKMIRSHGWDCKLNETKNYFVISARKET